MLCRTGMEETEAPIPIEFSRRRVGEGTQGWEVSDSMSISSSDNSQDLGGYRYEGGGRGGRCTRGCVWRPADGERRKAARGSRRRGGRRAWRTCA